MFTVGTYWYGGKMTKTDHTPCLLPVFFTNKEC